MCACRVLRLSAEAAATWQTATSADRQPDEPGGVNVRRPNTDNRERPELASSSTAAGAGPAADGHTRRLNQTDLNQADPRSGFGLNALSDRCPTVITDHEREKLPLAPSPLAQPGERAGVRGHCCALIALSAGRPRCLQCP